MSHGRPDRPHQRVDPIPEQRRDRAGLHGRRPPSAHRSDRARPVPSGRGNGGSDRRHRPRAVHDPQSDGDGPRPRGPAATGRGGAAGREPVHEYADCLEHSHDERCHCSRDGRGPGRQHVLPLAGADGGSDESHQRLGAFRWERGDGCGLQDRGAPHAARGDGPTDQRRRRGHDDARGTGRCRGRVRQCRRELHGERDRCDRQQRRRRCALGHDDRSGGRGRCDILEPAGQ